MRTAILLLVGMLISANATADTTPENKDFEIRHAITRMDDIAKLDKLNYLPNLLPVILTNRDFIGLSDDQVAELEEWRNTYKAPMLAAMNDIIQKRIEIKQAALSPSISSGKLMYMQTEIFRLQRAVLKYKLSCRERIMNTFNEENWISFYMVLADQDMGISIPLQVAQQSIVH